MAACRPTTAVTWSVTPRTPITANETTVTIELLGGPRAATARGALTLEAHMSHPGMAPVVTPMEAAGAGVYMARVPLTMAGEWTLVVSGALDDGRRLRDEHRVEVASAPPPG